jgi:hypothetical protein
MRSHDNAWGAPVTTTSRAWGYVLLPNNVCLRKHFKQVNWVMLVKQVTDQSGELLILSIYATRARIKQKKKQLQLTHHGLLGKLRHLYDFFYPYYSKVSGNSFKEETFNKIANEVNQKLPSQRVPKTGKYCCSKWANICIISYASMG